MSVANSDFQLLEKWGAGDQSAGEALFARHFDALYVFLRRRAIDSVEDLAQEAFLACVENRQQFRREASFRTYLLQIARYRLYAHYQRLSRVSEGEADRSATSDSSPTGKLERKQDERMLLLALRRLPAAFQVVLKLSFFDEMSGPQIAELLQIPEATVRNRVWRALRRLKEETLALAENASELRDTASELRTWAERIHHPGRVLPST